MVVEAASLTISSAALEVAWPWTGAAELPAVFPLLSHGATIVERDRVLDAARAELTLAGVWTDGHPAGRLATWLQAMARTDLELDLRARNAAGRCRAQVVRTPVGAVLIVLRDGEFTFTPVSEGSMVASIMSPLDEAPPAAGQLNAPSAELNRLWTANPSGRDLVARLRSLGARPADAAALAENLPSATGSAQIGAAVREHGRRRRARRVIALLDTDGGRYLVTERRAQDGTSWTTYAPALPVVVQRQVAELLAGTAREAGSGGVLH